MRVAFFSHSAGLNGAERSLLDIVLGTRIFDIQPIIILPRYGSLVEKLKSNNIEYIIYPYYGWISKKHRVIRGSASLLLNHLLTIGLAIKLRGMKIDIVYSNTLAIPVGAMIAKKLAVKHVWHIREFVQEDLGLHFNFGINYATRYVARNSTYIIYNSSAIKLKFNNLIADTPSQVIYNGWLIDESFHGLTREILTSKGAIKLCIVGSISVAKGQHSAIKALSILKENFTNISLDIVGTGEINYIQELKSLCSELKISSLVTWVGFSDNISKVYRQADIALVCSRSEAFGRVVIEAMAEGCPVVGSRSGGIQEIIKEGKNGLMYENGDINDLARQISILINDSTLYSTISLNGSIDVFNRFTRKRYAEQIYQVLKSL